MNLKEIIFPYFPQKSQGPQAADAVITDAERQLLSQGGIFIAFFMLLSTQRAVWFKWLRNDI